MRTIFEFFCRERENSGLYGGEGRIRTPETLQDWRGGIRPELGPLFGLIKSIRVGETLFALDSALLRISPGPFSRRADERNSVTLNIGRGLQNSNLHVSSRIREIPRSVCALPRRMPET